MINDVATFDNFFQTSRTQAFTTQQTGALGFLGANRNGDSSGEVKPAFDAVGLLNYQTTAYPLPQWKGNAYLQGEFGDHSLRLQVNYLDGYTDQRTSIFLPNTGALAGATVSTGKNIGSFTTFDATYRLQLKTGTTIAVSALNILDTDPPFARLDQNYDPFTASPLGFTAKISITQDF